MKNLILFTILLSSDVFGVTIADIGSVQGDIGYTAYQSSCIDINEIGQAACRVDFTGPSYKCGIRNSKTCYRVSTKTALYDNGYLTVVTNGIPNAINDLGAIAANDVVWINDNGDYISLTRTVVGASKTVFNYRAFTSEGSAINVPGIETTSYDTLTSPMVINNSGEIAGLQYATATSTLSGVMGLGGTGLFVTDDAMNEAILLGDDLVIALWPYKAVSVGWNSVISRVFDINDFGTVVVGMSGASSYPQLTKICTRDNVCAQNGGKVSGINNIGDAVGVFYPNPYSLVGVQVAWIDGVRIDLNSKITGSGYTVIAVSDINDSRQLAATCKKSVGTQVGCIINL